MNLHLIDPAVPGQGQMLLVHFGTGLVGSAISPFIVDSSRCQMTRQISVRWTEPSHFDEFSVRVHQTVTQMLDTIDRGVNPELTIIWSAGAAGFSTNSEGTELEFRNFQNALKLCRSLAVRFSMSNCRFLHTSSIGGLLEGTRRISHDAPIVARRPYGVLKQMQEDAVQSLSDQFQILIFRLPSVYGVPLGSARWNLIARLIHGTIHRESIFLVHRRTTLRDYVWNLDIGKYLARQALSSNIDTASSISFLASGKPTSIIELVRRTEQLVGRRVQYTIRPGWVNCEDITVDPRSLPEGWKPSPLSVGMRSMHQQFFRQWVQDGSVSTT